MRSEYYNCKFEELVADCARDIIDIFKENDVKEITFDRKDKDGIEPAYAVFYDVSDEPQDVIRISSEQDEDGDSIRLESSNAAGYIDELCTEAFREWYIFDIFRAVVEAINAGKFVKNED